MTVGTTWTASSLVAGLDFGPDNTFGTADDGTSVGGTSFVSRIGATAITGAADGTVGGTDSFGILAEQLVSLSINGSAVALTAGALNDPSAPLGTTGDFVLKELQA